MEYAYQVIILPPSLDAGLQNEVHGLEILGYYADSLSFLAITPTGSIAVI